MEPVPRVTGRPACHQRSLAAIPPVSVASLLVAVVFLLSAVTTQAPGGPFVQDHLQTADSRVGSVESNPVAARSNAPAFSQSNNSSAVVGIWQTSDGLVFQFDQSGGGDSFTSMVLNDSCTGGPGRSS